MSQATVAEYGEPSMFLTEYEIFRYRAITTLLPITNAIEKDTEDKPAGIMIDHTTKLKSNTNFAIHRRFLSHTYDSGVSDTRLAWEGTHISSMGFTEPLRQLEIMGRGEGKRMRLRGEEVNFCRSGFDCVTFAAWRRHVEQLHGLSSCLSTTSTQ
ncbi:hypothetical protein M3J09_010379 [Ascochyta lentis]